MATELPRFDRPIFFENDDDEFPYSIGGSAFVVSREGEYKVVTAKHCCLDRQADDMLVPVFSNGQDVSQEFLPICRVHFGKAADHEDDWYFADLMVLDVDVTKLESSDGKIIALPFDDTWKTPLDLMDGDKLIVRGHPTTLREADYDQKVIKQQAFLATGSIGKPAIGKHMRFMEFDDTALITSADGMSGSPVFRNRNNQFELAGMIVRGSIKAGGCHFVERPVIHKIISLACQ